MKKYSLILLLIFPLLSCKTIQGFKAAPGETVYLSFDDGPNCLDDTTSRLLDVLAARGVKAFFILLGVNAEKQPGLVRRMAAEGHTIVNHGYGDSFAYHLGDKKFVENLLAGEAALETALGYVLWPKLYRPQGGFYRIDQAALWEARGYILLKTDVRIYDAVKTARTADSQFESILKKIKSEKGGLVVLHDARDSWMRAEKRLARNPEGSSNRAYIPELVDKLIVTLRDSGYTMGSPEDFKPKEN